MTLGDFVGQEGGSVVVETEPAMLATVPPVAVVTTVPAVAARAIADLHNTHTTTTDVNDSSTTFLGISCRL